MYHCIIIHPHCLIPILPSSLPHSFPLHPPLSQPAPAFGGKPLWSLSGRSRIHPIQMAVKLGLEMRLCVERGGVKKNRHGFEQRVRKGFIR